MSSFTMMVSTQFHKILNMFSGKSSLNGALLELPKPVNQTSDYYAFVTNHYKQLGYTVWEYSKEKGLLDSEIHLVIKKNQDIILIQCKDDNQDLQEKNISLFENKAYIFLEENQIFSQYNIKLMYSMRTLLIDELAYKYIKKNPNINYEILK